MRLMYTLVAALVSACAAHAQDIETVLGDRQKAYEQDLAKVDVETRKQQEAWPVQYLQALKTLERKFQKAGDLDSLVAIQKEEERFAKAGNVTADVVEKAVPELADMQTKTVRILKDIDLGRCKQVVALADKHIAGLEELKKSLTTQGRIDDALKVKEQIGLARKRAEVTAAQFILADAGVAAEPAQPAAQARPVEVSGSGIKGLPLALLKGLVLYYPFDRDEGGKVTDKSGKGHDGREQGATWGPNGITGGAYEFDGRGSYIGVADSADLRLTSQFTLCAWVNIKGGQGTYRAILQKLGTSDRNDYLFTVNPANQWTICTDGSSGGWSVSGGTTEVGRWHHIVATYDHPIAKVYDDGVEIASSGRCRALPAAGAYEVRIGRASGAYYPFNGSIDEVRIYSRALSGQEVKQLFASYGTGSDLELKRR